MPLIFQYSLFFLFMAKKINDSTPGRLIVQKTKIKKTEDATSNVLHIRVTTTQPLLKTFVRIASGDGGVQIGANKVGVEWHNGVTVANSESPVSTDLTKPLLYLVFLVALLCCSRCAAPFHFLMQQ